MKKPEFQSKPNAPDDEQRICLRCGLCCDGTLFLRAHLNKNEKGTLPEKIEQNRFVDGEKEYFRLPCEYFDGKCTIYDLKRADICSSFRCNLLKSFREGIINIDDACTIVDDAVKMRDSICRDYRKFSGSDRNIPFRQILNEIGDKNFSGPQLDLFQARCNIFEALLIKFFRTEQEFKNIMQ